MLFRMSLLYNILLLSVVALSVFIVIFCRRRAKKRNNGVTHHNIESEKHNTIPTDDISTGTDADSEYLDPQDQQDPIDDRKYRNIELTEKSQQEYMYMNNLHPTDEDENIYAEVV